MSLTKTPLYNHHLKLGSKMAPFAGFEMPIQYSSIKEEVRAVRKEVGMFDVSHMGEFFVSGKDTYLFCDFLVPNDIKGAPIGKAIYSPLCKEDGTILDDLIIYKLEDNLALICVNASNIEKDWQHILNVSKNFSVTVQNKSDDYSLIAVQGPKSQEVLNIVFSNDTKSIPNSYYSVSYIQYKSSRLIVARTGYTGEDGFEIFIPNEIVCELWERLLDLNVLPCGLASRDVLRTEVCFPLYGHELDETLTPLDAGLKWTVKLSKGDFIGKKSLQNHIPRYKLLKLSLEKQIPRPGYSVMNESGEKVGLITSGTQSPTLAKGIALARIQVGVSESTPLFIEIRGNKIPAEIHKKPFIVGGHK